MAIYSVDINDGKISKHKYSDVSMDEPFVSRFFHFQSCILDALFDVQNIKDIKDAVMSILLEGLEPAFNSLEELKKIWADESVPEKRKIQHIENVYHYLVIALKDHFQYTAKLFGYDIGFIFQKEEAFKNGCVKFIEDYPEIGVQLVQTIEWDKKNWIPNLLDIRNYRINHPGDKDPELKKSLQVFFTPENAVIFFDYCWRCIEDLLFLFVIDKTKSKFGMILGETPEYKRDKNSLERFVWQIVINS